MGAQRVGWQYFLLALWRAASDDAIYDPSPLSSFIRESRKPQNGTTCQSLWIKRGAQRVNRTDRPTKTKIVAFYQARTNLPTNHHLPACLPSARLGLFFLSFEYQPDELLVYLFFLYDKSHATLRPGKIRLSVDCAPAQLSSRVQTATHDLEICPFPFSWNNEAIEEPTNRACCFNLCTIHPLDLASLYHILLSNSNAAAR